MAALGITIPSLSVEAKSLSGGQRQGIAIARAARWSSRLVILDEPTAALGVQETAKVEEMIKSLAERGLTIVLVTHRLDQVFRLADRVAVLRRGRLVGIRRTSETDGDEVVKMITGLAELSHDAWRRVRYIVAEGEITCAGGSSVTVSQPAGARKTRAIEFARTAALVSWARKPGLAQSERGTLLRSRSCPRETGRRSTDRGVRSSARGTSLWLSTNPTYRWTNPAERPASTSRCSAASGRSAKRGSTRCLRHVGRQGPGLDARYASTEGSRGARMRPASRPAANSSGVNPMPRRPSTVALNRDRFTTRETRIRATSGAASARVVTRVSKMKPGFAPLPRIVTFGHGPFRRAAQRAGRRCSTGTPLPQRCTRRCVRWLPRPRWL